jgi:hypothetical protein
VLSASFHTIRNANSIILYHGLNDAFPTTKIIARIIVITAKNMISITLGSQWFSPGIVRIKLHFIAIPLKSFVI